MATMTPAQLKVLSALGSASKGSTGASLNSACREHMDNSIDANCRNAAQIYTSITMGAEKKSLLVFADDGEGITSPDDVFMRSLTAERKSLRDGKIGNFQEGLRHAIGRLEPDKMMVMSRGSNGRSSLCLNYKDICADREDGSITEKPFRHYHATTEGSIDDTCVNLLNEILTSEDVTKGGKGSTFLYELGNALLDSTSDKTGTVILYMWDHTSTAPRIDQDRLYELYRTMNYINLVVSDDYSLESIFVGNNVVDSSTSMSLLGDSSVPRLVQKIWLQENKASYDLVVKCDVGSSSQNIGYSITKSGGNPVVTSIPSSRILEVSREGPPSCIVTHTCVSGKKRSSKGMVFGWKGRMLGDEPTYYEGKAGKQWNPMTCTTGMGAERTNCIASWIASVDIMDSKMFHMMFAGNLKDRTFPWYQGGETVEALVANFILSEVIGRVANAAASQDSGYEHIGVTTQGAWKTISRSVIENIAKRCKLETSRKAGKKSTKPPVTAASFFGNPRVVSTPPLTPPPSVPSSSTSPRFTVHRSSKTSYPGMTIQLSSLKKSYVLKFPSDTIQTGHMRKYLESVFKDMDDMSVDTIINREFARESRVFPMIVPNLKR